MVAISLATAAGGAMVFINTVVIVQTQLSLSEQHTAWALAVFGLGSMSAAMLVPRLVEDNRCLNIEIMQSFDATSSGPDVGSKRKAGLYAHNVLVSVSSGATILPCVCRCPRARTHEVG